MTSPPEPAPHLPLVCVGMPVYARDENVPGFVTALARVRAQTYTNLRIVVSDNCSPSPILKHLTDLAAADDPRIAYMRTPENRGPWDNFRRVFDATEGDFFVWAADDDLWEPEYIEACMAAFAAHPDTGLAFSRFERIDARGRKDRETIDMTGYNGSPGWPALRRIVAEPESFGRVNSIYGVWRRPLLRELMDMPFRWEFPGFDAPFVAAAMLRAGFRADPRVLFRKRGDKSTTAETVDFIAIDFANPKPWDYARFFRQPDVLRCYFVAFSGTRFFALGMLLMAFRIVREIAWEIRGGLVHLAKKSGLVRKRT